ncbi:hypothetical protein IWW34DRAFT_329075 [Fusarium oxysporum f. sp. albedinis]|nr:hypothetical protein IWW34DRAFT_329075 [Fusarium oxysporum f. sp. albedinis]
MGGWHCKLQNLAAAAALAIAESGRALNRNPTSLRSGQPPHHPKAATSDRLGCTRFRAGWGSCFWGMLRGLQWAPGVSEERASGRCPPEEKAQSD